VNRKKLIQLLFKKLKKILRGDIFEVKIKIFWIHILGFTKWVISALKVPFQIFTPDAFFTIFWNFLILLIVLYDLFIKPFQFSFFDNNRNEEFLLKSSIICGAIFSLDMIFNFRTAFYDKGVLVVQSSTIFRRYLRYNFLWDFVAVCSDFVSLAYTQDACWFLKILSVIRVRKLLHLTTRVEDFLNLSRSSQSTLKLLKLWATIMIFAHWLACFFHYIAYRRINVEDTWISQTNMLYGSIAERYVFAFYWSTATMLTVGYGDVVPISIAERVYSIAAMVMACVVFGYSLNTVADIIKEMSYEKDQRRFVVD